MQKSNLRRGLLAGATVLVLAGCSFHHRDDRSDTASAQPTQQGSSRQAAAYNRPAQGMSATTPNSAASGSYSSAGEATVDNGTYSNSATG